MAMAGMRPVVAVYSTFFSRAFDQANLDVGLHGLPVVMVLDRAGITGDDGPSHHGVLDMALALSIPGMTVFAPSSAPEVEVMLAQALTLDGPSIIRFPKTPAPWVAAGALGSGMDARRTRSGDGSVCILAVGKMLAAAESAADELEAEGIDVDRVGRPGGLRPRSGHAGRRRRAPGGDHRRGRGPPGRGRHVPRRRPPATAPDGAAPPVISLGTPRSYIAQGKPDQILAQLGLDGPGLGRSVRQALRDLPGEYSGPLAGEVPTQSTGPLPAHSAGSLPPTVVSNEALE